MSVCLLVLAIFLLHFHLSEKCKVWAYSERQQPYARRSLLTLEWQGEKRKLENQLERQTDKI